MAQTTSETLASARILVVGVGGLGGPAAWILAREGVGTLGLVDDDVVEESNLHRQIQFRTTDVGRSKIEAMTDRLTPFGTEVVRHEGRFLPKNADALAADYDLVLEGSDNFATKFLAAEVAIRAGKPVVQASAIRWVGTVVASRGPGCYACLFESAPEGAQESCDLSGVLGPVVGLTAAIAADLAIQRIRGELEDSVVVSVDGRKEVPARRRTFSPRRGCDVCGRRRSV